MSSTDTLTLSMFQTFVLNCVLDVIYKDVPQIPNFNPLFIFYLFLPSNAIFPSNFGCSPLLPVSMNSTYLSQKSVCVSPCLSIFISFFPSNLTNHQILPLIFAWFRLLPSAHENCYPDSGPHHLWYALQFLPNWFSYLRYITKNHGPHSSCVFP